MTDLVTLTGASGRPYNLAVFPLSAPWACVPAIYGFATRGLLGFGVLYIGHTENIKDRLADHHKWNEALRRGMTCVLAMEGSSNVLFRLSVEADLIQAYRPPLNETLGTRGLAQAPLGGVFGLGGLGTRGIL